jgi:outer membrane lipoprotein carrier protein
MSRKTMDGMAKSTCRTQSKRKRIYPLKCIANENKSAPLVLIIFLLACSVASAALPAQGQPVQEVVASVESHYGALKTLTAKVTQKNRLKAVGMTQKFDGTLWIEKPGKLRLDYTNGQVLLIDDKAALFYSKKSEQVIKKTFTDFQLMNIPVTFLLGAAHIRDDFDVLQSDQKTPRSMELLPKKPGAAMKKLIMASDAEGRITSLTIFDKSGNITEIVFSKEEDGVAIDDKLFIFKIPKGTEVIEQ